jgi:uncharacterized SAM-dependent methyltransferase
MKVEVVLTEADLTEEFAEAIEARDLPEKFFFWFPRSAAEWSRLAADAELYGGLQTSWREICDAAPEIARRFDGKVPLISFGAGDGARDRMLAQSLGDAGCQVSYFPVDASQTMLELACGGAEDADIETVGIKADISSPVHLVYAADAADPPRLFLFCGNTLGAFDPLAEIRYLTQSIKPEDRLIVDGELWDEKATMGRRDNPKARRFLSAMLSSLGIAATDGEIRFDRKADSRRDGLHLVTRYFHAARDLSATVAGEVTALERGERIGMNFQYVYTADAFRWLLREHGGLVIEREYFSPDGRFLTAICRK